MKKILSIIMTLVMLTTITNSMTNIVFAEEAEEGNTITEGTEEQEGTTEISYLVNPTYTVIIPTNVELGQEDPATISATEVLIEKGQQVKVAITETNKFEVTSAEGAVLEYIIEKDNTAIEPGDTILTVNPANAQSGSAELYFNAPTDIKYAGTYSGTITFTVSVIPATSN